MRRRMLLGLAFTALTAPAKVFAQVAQRVYRIGAFQFSQTPLLREHMRAFRERMGQLGFVEPRSLQIAEEYSSFDSAARQQSAEKLVRARPDVILTFGSTNTRLIQAVSNNKIPIVFTIVGDPVAYGLVNGLARPGGNTTGVASLQREVAVKRLELLREILPKAKRVILGAYLKDVSYIATEPLLRQTATRLGLELIPVEVGADPQLVALGKAVRARAGEAVFVYQPMSFIVGFEMPEKIVQLAMAERLPVFFAESDLVARGGLLSYGPDFLDETRRAADQVAKILRGANAGELPVEQSTRFELVVNARAAQALGIEIPLSVRPRVDRVIK